MVFSKDYLAEIEATIRKLDSSALELLACSLAAVRHRNGRLFVIGIGGGASLAAHAVSDLRMMADFEAYAPTDNVTELTARINDYGWDEAISGWLRMSHVGPRDALLVFSVGGGNLEKNVSVPLVNAMAYARDIGAAIYAVVGPMGGTAREMADVCILIPATTVERRTPITESLQAVVWHLLMSHPALKRKPSKWEEIDSEREGTNGKSS